MQDMLDALVDALLWVPLKLWELLLDGLASVLESIPVPEWASGLSGLAGNIPSSVLYFAEPFNLGYGIAVLTSAYGIRFIIRRLPVIG